jgi:hypothetical protein
LQNVDLTNQEVIQRPYPIYATLREELPDWPAACSVDL